MSEFNWQRVAEAVRRTGGATRPGDIAGIYGAMEALRHLPFPPGFLDSVRDQMVEALRGEAKTAAHPLSVYLAFHGTDDLATYMKVGIAKSVTARMSALKTGNPLTRLWTFSAVLPDRKSAYRLEQGILKHLSSSKAEGEWVQVRCTGFAAAIEIVASLEEFARVFLANNDVRFCQED